MILTTKKILCIAGAMLLIAPLAFACTETAPSMDADPSYSLFLIQNTNGSFCANNVGESFGCTMRGSMEGLASGAVHIATWTRGGAEFISTAVHHTVAHANVAGPSGTSAPFDSILASIAKTTSSLLRTLSSFFSALGSAIWPF